MLVPCLRDANAAADIYAPYGSCLYFRAAFLLKQSATLNLAALSLSTPARGKEKRGIAVVVR